MEPVQRLSGQIVDVHGLRTFPGEVEIRDGRIGAIRPTADVDDGFLMPGFVDAHVHIESSMLVPSQFARLAVRHGTVATVSDPHEIANVMGMDGIRYMLDDAAQSPLKVFFGAPSCVPATPFETAGARLDPADVDALLADPRIGYLSEMMNYPGVIHGDPDVLAKLASARKHGKRVDGHAPLVRGDDLRAYAEAGISTDHECSSAAEALEKLHLGILIAIREGSAARNFDALIPLLSQWPESMMFCSDDKHPDDLLIGHIDRLAARAIEHGCDLWDVLQAACVTPVRHYGLNVGLLRAGEPADLIRVRDLRHFQVQETWIDGRHVAEAGTETFQVPDALVVNRFEAPRLAIGDFAMRAEGSRIRYIEAIDGEIVTGSGSDGAKVDRGMAVADPERDLLKIAVVNRYLPAPPAIGFIRGFGLQSGAIASSVAHDSHNIIVVGADDASMKRAVDALAPHGGGLCAVSSETQAVLALPVAGLMSNRPAEDVAAGYQKVDAAAKALGSTLRAPFMTLSFMGLLVIPSLKLGDRGLFDGRSFEFTSVFTEE